MWITNNYSKFPPSLFSFSHQFAEFQFRQIFFLFSGCPVIGVAHHHLLDANSLSKHSRICGISSSVTATSISYPSIWVVPTIMFCKHKKINFRANDSIRLKMPSIQISLTECSKSIQVKSVANSLFIIYLFSRVSRNVRFGAADIRIIKSE